MNLALKCGADYYSVMLKQLRDVSHMGGAPNDQEEERLDREELAYGASGVNARNSLAEQGRNREHGDLVVLLF